MNLIESMSEEYIMMDKTRTPDGEGGFIVNWNEGARFSAAVTMDSTMQAVIAQSQGVTSVYTVTTNRNVVLEYHDVIKRASDGRVFRITSDGTDKKSPVVSSLDIRQVTAEGWELTA